MARRCATRPRLETLEDRTLLHAGHLGAGLVAAFGFEEGAGFTAADHTDHHNDAALSGATWTTAGRFGNAVSFDGVNDWLTVADSASLDLTTGLTLEAWVRPAPGGGWRTVLMKEADGGLTYQLYASDGNDRAVTYVTVPSNPYAFAQDGGPLVADTWTHLAATFDNAALRLYVNGALASETVIAGPVLTSELPLRLGGNAVWGEFYKGLIDEVRIYNRVLGASEIAHDMNSAVVGNQDATPPTVLSVTPAAGATGISAATTITATFSEAVTGVSSSTFELRDAANNLVNATVSYNATTRVATLTPAAALGSATTYTARVKGGATGVKDAAGNALAADHVWSFTTADTVAPTVTAVAPAAGATNVALNAAVTATFSEAVTGVSSSTFELRDAANNLVNATVSYNASTRVATLTPAAALGSATTYTARVKGGATGVKDAAGNALAVDRVWSFTTVAVDTTAPVVTGVAPPQSSTNVSAATTVTATFSEAVTNVSTTTFELRDAANTLVNATVSYNASTRTATLAPLAALSASTAYTARVKGGTAGVRDLAGNALAADRVWTFTTAAASDTTPPTVTAVTPAAGATGVSAATPVTATFSETVTGVSTTTFELRDAANNLVNATVAYNATTRVATLTPAAALGSATTYTARVKGGATGVKDAAGNALAVDRVWSFTTADTVAPTVTVVAPAAAATNVALNATVTATFNEAVTGVSATTFELRDAANNLVAAAVTYDALTRTATLVPNVALAGSTTFTARVKGGATGVKDAAGNALAADRVWTFTTAAPPTGGFQLTTTFEDLDLPTAVRFAPDGRVFVAEKAGVIKVFDSLSDTTPTVVADLTTDVYNAFDRGLLGLAVDPNFASNGAIYALYTYDSHTDRTAPVWGTAGEPNDPIPDPPGADTNGIVVSGRLVRLRVGANGVATGPQEVLIDKQWLNQFSSHSIGSLNFGPDGLLYVSAGDGASFNFIDFGQTPTNVDPRNPASMGDPDFQGGALRSQDILSPGDPTALNGSILRLDPATGLAAPGNPLGGSADGNARRIVAHGLRNPFRFTFRPGTSEIWVGDVGWTGFEEINRLVAPADATVDNFGWPAYEGPGRQAGYDGANLPLLESLYDAGPAAVVAPYYSYSHGAAVIPGDDSPGGASVSGVAFYTGGDYPAKYRNALFFGDYSRNRVWAMLPGANGLPDPGRVEVLIADPLGPVDLQIGPGGDLFVVSIFDGSVKRLDFVTTNRTPTAAFTATPAAGPAPLTVQFDATASSDPDSGTTLSYAWDLDGDGQLDDSTAARPTFTYATGGNRTVTLRVTDNGGLADTETLVIQVGNTAPTATIDSPTDLLSWRVGQTITFAGRARDPEQGTLPATALTWTILQHHNNHIHPVTTFTGVAGGSFVAPDHELEAYLEIVLTATDAGGLTSTTSVSIFPETVDVTLASDPSGVTLAINSNSAAAPFETEIILAGSATVSAPPTATLDGQLYQFVSWSDGGAATHNITATAFATLTANYALMPTITISDATVTEGRVGNVSLAFTLTLSAPTSRPVTVTYATANGTATAGSDYVALPPTAVTLAAGAVSTRVVVAVRPDTLTEGAETLFLNLSTPVNAVLGDAQGQGTILDAGPIGPDAFGYRAEAVAVEAIDLAPGAAGVFTIRESGNNNVEVVDLPAGSTFSFYGTSYTRLFISTNGLITLGSGTTSASNTDLTSSPNMPAIAALWDDWASTTGNAILLGRYQDTNGDGTSDRLIIEWNQVQGSGSSPSAVTFQVILSLNTGTAAGDLVFNYVDLDAGNSRSNGGSATVGIKAGGTQGTSRLLVAQNASTNPYVAGGQAVRIRR